ncbi:MAG: hypothetical protein Q7S29_06330 [Candidatus Peribacter sp.]|nr:hypothetical protein [Candidatus Peribacter sp.]
MRHTFRSFLVGTLFLVPALAFGKTYVVPHVLERSNATSSVQVSQSGAGQTSMPSVDELQRMIQSKTGLTDIKWNRPIGQSKRHVKLTGTGMMGENLSVNINCTVSYPPLSIRCTITVNL